MSSKFSAAPGVQSTPPVCGSAVVLPVPWDPPPFPDIAGFVHWSIRRYDGEDKEHKTNIYLPWSEPADRWLNSKTGPGWTLDVEIGPPTHGQPLQVDIFHWEANAPMLHTTWDGPVYLLGENWQSGINFLDFPADHAWTWQTFATR